MKEEGRKTVRCAIYTRQSIDRGDGNNFNSSDAQREACEFFVQSMRYEGWRIIEERFDDVGYSGKDLDRPAFQRLLVWIAEEKVDQLVVHRFDRLTRNLHDWSKLNEFLKEYSVTLSLVDGGCEATGSAFTEFVTNILATFGQFEREIIQERMQEARQFRASKGMRFAGRAPIGYISDPISKQLVVQDEEADLVRSFFEQASKGQSAAAIARMANEAGHRTKKHGKKEGKLWTGKTILQILRNPVYLGQRQYNGKLISGVHQALLNEDLAKNALIQIESRRSRKPGRRKPLKQDPFMLRGILRCGKCDRLMTTSSSRKRGDSTPKGKNRYYRCRGNSTAPACKPAVQVAAHLVEAQVFWLLTHPWKIKGTSRKTKQLLKDLSFEWQQLSVAKTASLVRELVWSATWDPEQKKVRIKIDEINLERIFK